LAPDLIDEKEVLSTLKPGGLILINNAMTTDAFGALQNFHLALVDALAVSEAAGLGGTINTAILGGYARANGGISMSCLEQAIRETVPAKVDANIEAARRAYDVTRIVS